MHVRTGSGSPGQDEPSLFREPSATGKLGLWFLILFFFFLLFSFTVHVLSPPRRFWDWDKVCKVCRYFPAGVLARLLTQVLLVFCLFFTLFLFPLPFHMGQRRMGIPWSPTEWAMRTARAERRNGLIRRFFQLGRIGQPGQSCGTGMFFVSLWRVHRYRTLMVLTLPFSCLPGHSRRALYTRNWECCCSQIIRGRRILKVGARREAL
jgi:hypothetical protein